MQLVEAGPSHRPKGPQQRAAALFHTRTPAPMPPAIPGRARRTQPESGVGAEGFGSPPPTPDSTRKAPRRRTEKRPRRPATSETQKRAPERKAAGHRPPPERADAAPGHATRGAEPNRTRPAHRERRSAASRTKTWAFPGFSARGRGSKNRKAASRPTVGLAFRPSSRKEGEDSVFRLPACSPPQNRHWGNPLPGTWKTNPSPTTSPTPGAR